MSVTAAERGIIIFGISKPYGDGRADMHQVYTHGVPIDGKDGLEAKLKAYLSPNDQLEVTPCSLEEGLADIVESRVGARNPQTVWTSNPHETQRVLDDIAERGIITPEERVRLKIEHIDNLTRD